jgi:tetratricopeptide (TPR) repeat protein
LRDPRRQRLSEAASRYRAGQWREAEAVFREVLAEDPQNADALFFLGSIAVDRGRLSIAEPLLRQALVRRPLEPAFHAALGNALARAARHEEALASYRTALALNPGLIELRLNVGHALRALNRPAEALAAYEALLAKHPSHPAARVAKVAALVALGRREAALAQLGSLPQSGFELEEAEIRLALGEVDEAIGRYSKLIEKSDDPRARLGMAAALLRAGTGSEALEQARAVAGAKPRDPAVVLELAMTLARCGAPAEALTHLERLLRWDDRPDLRARQAALLLELDRNAEAAEALRAVVAKRPADADAHCNLGLALLGTGHADEAIAALREALRVAPGHWQALHNLGLAELRRGQLQDALAALEKAHTLKPDDVELEANFGYICALARDFERGERLLRHAVALDPSQRKARRYLALYLLARGRFAEGWDLMKEQPSREKLRTMGRSFEQPWWQGEPLSGRSILVWGDQGLGDEIMYASAVPDLMAMGARVVVECAGRLERLFARSFPQATVVPHGAAGRGRISAAAPELQMRMSGLPVYLRRTREAFPRHRGYLRAAPERVVYWQARLAALGPGAKIGISWAGGTGKTGKGRRSTTLEDWLPVLRVPGVQYVSLQYTDCRADLARLREQHGIHLTHWQEAIDDYEETAALVTALDAVASVVTAVIHLAGALGRPTYVLVPWWPSWRYGLEGEQMPWYPSARLLRQQQPSDWSAPIARLAAELARR